MKFLRSIFFVVVSILSLSTLRGQDAAQQLDKAFARGDVDYVIKHYQDELSRGISLDVNGYFNLARAYQEESDLGRSILNYRRALRLAPKDPRILHNLAIVEGMTVDRFADSPSFLERSLTTLAYFFSSNELKVLELIAFGVMLAAFLCFKLSQRWQYRKAGFIISILGFFVVLYSLLMIGYQHYCLEKTAQEAVIVVKEVALQPLDTASTKPLDLHAGALVYVREIREDHARVALADGREGVLPLDAINFVVPQESKEINISI